MQKYIKIIKNICNELNIEMQLLSKDFVIMLKKDSKIKFIFGYKFGSNDHAIGNILDDKFGTSDVLTALNIPCIENKIFYRENNKNEYAQNCNSIESVVDFFHKYNNNIVLKPNNGTCGRNVFKINDEKDLKEKYKKLLLTNFAISASPYYDIDTEYRAIVVSNSIELIYGKVRPIVIGNGGETIKELLIKFNPDYFTKTEILEDEKYNFILPNGEKYEYNWKFNLEGGANINMQIDSELKDKISNMAKDVASKLNVNFGSIDIVLTKNKELKVLEINSGVMMKNFVELHQEGEEIAYGIYKKAIMNMFEM